MSPAGTGLGLFLIWTMVDLGAVFEARGWLPASEIARLAVGGALLALGLDGPAALPLLAVGAVAVALSALWLLRHRAHFQAQAA